MAEQSSSEWQVYLGSGVPMTRLVWDNSRLGVDVSEVQDIGRQQSAYIMLAVRMGRDMGNSHQAIC